jgi:signal peptidase II
MQAAGGATLSNPEAPGSEVGGSEIGAAELALDDAAAPRRGRIWLVLGIAVFVIAADVISKVIVVAKITPYSHIRLVGTLLQLTLERNGGAAFNLGGTSMTIVFTAIAAGVVIYILRTARNLRSIGWAVALGLLLGGATGNLLDRIFRAPGPFRGYVIDWIQLPHWPVFNLADSSICCGGVLIALLALRGIRFDGSQIGTDPADAGRQDPDA